MITEPQTNNTSFLSPHPSPTTGWPPGVAVLQRLLKESSALMIAHRTTCAEAEKAYRELWAFTSRLLHDACRANIFEEGRCYVAKDAFFGLTILQRERLLKAVQEFSSWVDDAKIHHDQGYVQVHFMGDSDWFFYHKLVAKSPDSMDEVEGWHSTVWLIPVSDMAVESSLIFFDDPNKVPFGRFWA